MGIKWAILTVVLFKLALAYKPALSTNYSIQDTSAKPGYCNEIDARKRIKVNTWFSIFSGMVLAQGIGVTIWAIDQNNDATLLVLASVPVSITGGILLSKGILNIAKYHRCLSYSIGVNRLLLTYEF